jgi:hypothetical protein
MSSDYPMLDESLLKSSENIERLLKRQHEELMRWLILNEKPEWIEEDSE